MNKKLQIQKRQLQSALNYATMIEDCDKNIEFGRHVNYYKSVRAECIEKYADAVADIIEGSIDIAVQFQQKQKPFDQKLMQHINNITNDYKNAV